MFRSFVIASLVVAAAPCRGDDERNVSIIVTGTIPETVRRGESIPLTITVRNGLLRTIDFHSFTTTPSPANLELQNVGVTGVRRGDDDRDVVVAAPKIDEIALRAASPGLVRIPPGEARTVRTDLTKWRIRGGWTEGRYRVSVRVHRIRVDRFSSVTTDGEPVEFVIVPPKSEPSPESETSD